MAELMGEADETYHDPRPPTTTHLGRAGEQFVASHLLRLGYNATPLPIDMGVDLLAHWTTKSGESRVAQFQVKTTQQKRISFRLRKRQLERLWAEGINLVVVFWYEPASPFALVIPPSLSYMLTSGGHKDSRAPIRVGANGAILVFGSSGARRAHTRNRYHDLSAMIDRFDRIEATDEDYSVIRPYADWSTHDKALVEFDAAPAS
jgi:hypothetical protein